MSNKFIWPVLILVAALMAGILAWTNSANPLRSIILFLFMLVIPGLAFTRLFHFRDFLAEIVFAVVLSLVTGTILAEFMVFTHLWSPYAGLDALIGLSIIGAALQLVKGKQSASERGME